MKNHSPALLDRLDKALKTHGHALKRTELLAVAAAAFGYRNSNEYAAAARKGDLSPPPAEVVGQISVDSEDVMILRDPTATALYGVDKSFIEQVAAESRAEEIGVTPYGHLVDLGPALDQEAPAIGVAATTLPVQAGRVHAAAISHRHGIDVVVDANEEGLEAQIAAYCAEYWRDARAYKPELPETVEGMTNDEIINDYFEAVSDEDLVRAGAMVLRHAPTGGTLKGYVIAATDPENPEEPALWWNNEDGWGSLDAATVFPEPTEDLPVVSGSLRNIRWEALPGTKGPKPQRADDLLDQAAQCLRAQEPAMDGIRAKVHARPDCIEIRLEPATEKILGYVNENAGAFGRAGAIIHMRDKAVVFRIKASEIRMAATPEDWARAFCDLLDPARNPRVMARFHPQAWQNDYAVPVDPEGETVFDVTYEVLAMGKEAALALEDNDYDSDWLRDAVRAPEWIRQWNATGWVEVSEAIADSGLFH